MGAGREEHRREWSSQQKRKGKRSKRVKWHFKLGLTPELHKENLFCFAFWEGCLDRLSFLCMLDEIRGNRPDLKRGRFVSKKEKSMTRKDVKGKGKRTEKEEKMGSSKEISREVSTHKIEINGLQSKDIKKDLWEVAGNGGIRAKPSCHVEHFT